MGAPTHREMLTAWSTICASDASVEDSAMLLLPIEDGVVVAAFYPTEMESIGECISRATDELLGGRAPAEPFGWAAVVAPAFMEVTTDMDAAPEGMELQRRYAQGDDNVREIVSVTILEFGEKPTTLSYSQPLLEQIEESPVDVEGLIALALLRVILCSMITT